MKQTHLDLLVTVVSALIVYALASVGLTSVYWAFGLLTTPYIWPLVVYLVSEVYLAFLIFRTAYRHYRRPEESDAAKINRRPEESDAAKINRRRKAKLAVTLSVALMLTLTISYSSTGGKFSGPGAGVFYILLVVCMGVAVGLAAQDDS